MFRRRRQDSDFSAEVEAHIQHESERLREQGLSDAEARAAARRAFGNVMQAEERFHESGRWQWGDQLWQDLRFSLRMLAKNPGFAAVAVITLALGIAINATMFSLVSAFLLRRPPGREPERVVVISTVNPVPGFQTDATPVSAPNYISWKAASKCFVDVTAGDPNRRVSLTVENQPESVRSAAISPNYFDVLGVSPEIGRTFLISEDQPGQDHVAILSHDLWERRFGSDPSVVGRTIRVNRENYDVVGVMPKDFQLLGYTTQVWTPLVINTADQSPAARNDRSLYMFARLKPNVTVEQARAEAVTVARRTADAFPESEKGWGVAVRTLPDFLIYDFSISTGLAILMTTVGFVLLIACANVAGLLLARAAGRRKELAIRISLGAGRLRVVRQLLTEGLVIAVLGGGTGLLLAYWGINFMRASLSFNEAISAVPFRLDWNVLLYALGISIVCAVLCGVAPALNAARTDINTNLKDESRAASAGRSQTRLRTVMVVGEIALALLLLVGTGLLIRAISDVHNQNLGFRADSLLTVSFRLDDARYKGAAKQIAFVNDVIRHVEQIPGAETAAVTSDLPATGASSVTLRVKGQQDLPTNQRMTALDFVVSTDYFRAAGIPLLRGRTFTETDVAATPSVVMVNQEFVHRILQDQEPLGKQIGLVVSGAPSQWSEIVGVVGNVKTYSEGTEDDPEVYEAFLQRPVGSMSLMVRSSSDPNGLASALRNAVAQVDAELPLSGLMSMRAVIEYQKGGNPFFMGVLGTFAVMALILAGIGIYGLVSYSVGQRRHEFGIRMALGATGSDVLRMILWQGIKMTAAGVAIGTLLALPLPRVFDSLFFGIHVREPWLYFIVVAITILMVAMVATFVPARRAQSIDPMTALRVE
ncbi:MAG TPA: ABC transporter permease [Candidatus Acidoferrales bacterium]|nr:ABC transporter permease [Candidatus Acidoferrales bacterium]